MHPLRIRLRSVVDETYSVAFHRSLRDVARDILRRYPGGDKFVVTDSNVGPRHGAAFSENGFTVITVPAGERSKSRAAKERLEDRLLRLRASRASLVVALGGGMIGDLAGFTAATLLRGVPFVQVPTSLLAQVDASVGGKVAIDHPLGKNLLGAFHQPKRVYIAVSALRTLPDREFRSGLAEAVKCGAVLDARFFAWLERNAARILARDERVLEALIRRACALKASVVVRDPHEGGPRRILNYGHTIGHAVESVSRFRLRHGEAVAVGMMAEARIAHARGALADAAILRLAFLLRRFGLPTAVPRGIAARAILRATRADKKSLNGVVGYTLPSRIGGAALGVPVRDREAMGALRP